MNHVDHAIGRPGALPDIQGIGSHRSARGLLGGSGRRAWRQHRNQNQRRDERQAGAFDSHSLPHSCFPACLTRSAARRSGSDPPPGRPGRCRRTARPPARSSVASRIESSAITGCSVMRAHRHARDRAGRCRRPAATPISPPSTLRIVASVRNCVSTLFRVAPMALRMPISRVRSVTDTSMMFMMPMPPTSSEMPATPPRNRVRTPVIWWPTPACLAGCGW